MSLSPAPNSGAAPPDTEVWDPSGLLRQVDGDLELAAELVSIFLEDEPQMRSDLQTAIRTGSADGIAHAAHAYRGSASALGSTRVANAAAEIESAGRAGRAEVAAEWERFESRANRLVETLAGALQTLSSG